VEKRSASALRPITKNKIRIIGGEWRSRQINFVDAPGLRPTPDRVRETLFNWLQFDIPGSRCLDLYAGSGALGFEAASRGAKSVVQVENNPDACRALQETAVKLAATQVKIVQSDVLRYLAGDAEAFDIVFLDPPFSLNLVPQTCHWLEDKGWLNPHTKIYVETESKLKFLDDLPTNWQLLKSKTAGDVSYKLLKKSS
jgi:16S rRNA (guanine966-N2)-methyltransferase